MPDGDERVTKFGPGGAFAYRRGELVIPDRHRSRADDAIRAMGRWRDGETRSDRIRRNKLRRYEGVGNTLQTRARLVEAGIPARLNHVLFATTHCGCASYGVCPPHPRSDGAKAFYEAHPFYSNPFYSNPFYSNPFYSNPFYSNPFYSNAEQNPAASGLVDPCDRPSSAAAANPPVFGKGGTPRMRVGILDTGYATATFAPQQGVAASGDASDEPDADGDTDLDPVAGHGTFIAGVVEQQAPNSIYQTERVVSSCGEADEVGIAAGLERLIDRGGNRPHFVNMSLAGYSPYGMETLTEAIAEARCQDIIVVASAGNDATCAPAYPAALPDVIGVGALEPGPDPEDPAKTVYEAAEFTNYGPWVTASAPGVDIESIFFEGWPDAQNDQFMGRATWSGTSFAAPHVVGVLAATARRLKNDRPNDFSNLFEAAEAAVDEVILGAGVERLPMLGVVVP